MFCALGRRYPFFHNATPKKKNAHQNRTEKKRKEGWKRWKQWKQWKHEQGINDNAINICHSFGFDLVLVVPSWAITNNNGYVI